MAVTPAPAPWKFGGEFSFLNDVKDCPFCGSEELKIEIHERLHELCCVECVMCHAHGPWARKLSEATEKWNRRLVAA